MLWDTSATFGLLGAVGGVASVSVSWYERRRIQTVGRWITGELSWKLVDVCRLLISGSKNSLSSKLRT